MLYLQNNRIPGKVPAELCLCTKLDMCNMSNNQLNGHIPKNIGDMARLRVFRLTNNNIRGPVPLSMARLLNLKDFHVFKSFPAEDTEQVQHARSVPHDPYRVIRTTRSRHTILRFSHQTVTHRSRPCLQPQFPYTSPPHAHVTHPTSLPLHLSLNPVQAIGFKAVEYDRIYRFGQAAGFDHAHWVPSEVYGAGCRGKADVYGNAHFESASDDEGDNHSEHQHHGDGRGDGDKLHAMVGGMALEESRYGGGVPPPGLDQPLSMTGSLGVDSNPSLMSLPTVGGDPSMTIQPPPTR